MKVARWISLFTIIATLSCNSPYLQIETGSNSIYSVLGYFTKDMVKVELLVNNNFNENIDLLNKTEIKTAQIYLIDSLRNQKVLIPYNENKSFYYLDGLNLERSNKYMLEIEGADMVAKTSFVQLPNPLELVEFTKDMEVNKNKLAMEVSLSWNPKGEECIESQVFDIENKKLYLEPLDFLDISQCFNKYTFTTVYFRNCYYVGDTTHILQTADLQKNSQGSIVLIKKIIFAACSKEYTEFINSIYFVEDFERAFIYTGIIKSNIKSINSTGYFYGRDEVVIDL